MSLFRQLLRFYLQAADCEATKLEAAPAKPRGYSEFQAVSLVFETIN
jgi:hypothetical protein